MSDRPLTDRQGKALRALAALQRERLGPWTAHDIAHEAGIGGVNRAGNGAVKGSWSGRTAPGFALASTMQSLKRHGLVRAFDSGQHRYVSAYHLTNIGERVVRDG